MRLSIVASLATCLITAHAFKNTSPFILFSTSESNSPSSAHPKQLQSNDEIISSASQALSSCPSKHYVLISQESVGVEDFSSKRAVPFFRRAMKNEGIKSVLNVAEVVDQSSTEDMARFLQKHCGAGVEGERDGEAKITRVKFDGLPSSEPARSAKLADNDAYLNSILEKLATDYTVIYTTTPISPETQITYEPTFQEPLHVELKRQMNFAPREEKNTTVSSLPLFEKYQFLSPGIFMGLITVFILIAILTVGISAIAGLQVSYGAFDKEMGPAAGKKQ